MEVAVAVVVAVAAAGHLAAADGDDARALEVVREGFIVGGLSVHLPAAHQLEVGGRRRRGDEGLGAPQHHVQHGGRP